MEYCHYYDSKEREIHITDVKPCRNCSAPVCSSCRTAEGFCEDCDEIKDDEQALLERATSMEALYNDNN
jgi:hypothetical protein